MQPDVTRKIRREIGVCCGSVDRILWLWAVATKALDVRAIQEMGSACARDVQSAHAPSASVDISIGLATTLCRDTAEHATRTRRCGIALSQRWSKSGRTQHDLCGPLLAEECARARPLPELGERGNKQGAFCSICGAS
eukprot:6635329-Prymnesium_polylepis.3